MLLRRSLIFRWVRYWTRRGIRRKLVLWSILFWVVSISALSYAFLWFGQTEILNEARRRNVQLASVVSRDVNARISSLLADIRTFSRRLESVGPDLEDQAAALLALRLSSPQRYRAVYYFDNQGRLLLQLSDPLESLLPLQDLAPLVTRPPLRLSQEVLATRQMVNGEGTYLSDVTFAGIDRIPVVYVGIPVKPGQGAARVLVVEIDLRDIWRRIDLTTIGQSGFAYAVSRQGIIVAHRDPAYLGRPVPKEIGGLSAGYEGFTEHTEPLGQNRVTAAYSPVGGSAGWGIVIQQDEAEANAGVLKVGAFVIGIWAVLAAAGISGILIMMRSFTRPISELTRTTQGIARTGYLRKTGLAQTDDEIGQLSQAFDLMIERLQTTEGRLTQVAAEERNRLARDLHDAVSQTLFAASLIAEVLPNLWERNRQEGQRRLEEVRQLTRGALAEMRTLLLELRPASLVEAELGYLLHQLGEAFHGRSRVPVTVTVDRECSPPDEVKVALYRIVQEALNNVAKHARASEARVVLRCDQGLITLSVSDDGGGFEVSDVPHDTLGLGIMRERARDIGATLSVESKPGQGTEVVAVWKDEEVNHA